MFAKLLSERTQAPVPWPMLFDKQNDIFGWPYLIMPRMPDKCFQDREVGKLPREDQLTIARALGRALAEQQKLEWEFAGEFDLSFALVPYPHGHIAHLVSETTASADRVRRNGRWRDEDHAWLGELFDHALTLPSSGRPNVYVHGDFKFNNLTLSPAGSDWTVTGLFDLHESRFGDGASDLCRQTCSYLDFKEEDAAYAFISSYRANVADDPTLAVRMPVYVVNDRMKFWEYFTRPETNAPWLEGKTFKSWTGGYIARVLELL